MPKNDFELGLHQDETTVGYTIPLDDDESPIDCDSSGKPIKNLQNMMVDDERVESSNN